MWQEIGLEKACAVIQDEACSPDSYYAFLSDMLRKKEKKDTKEKQFSIHRHLEFMCENVYLWSSNFLHFTYFILTHFEAWLRARYPGLYVLTVSYTSRPPEG